MKNEANLSLVAIDYPDACSSWTDSGDMPDPENTKGDINLETFRESIRAIVEASSQAERRKQIGKFSMQFYQLCREEGLEQEDIIQLTTQILDCFLTDLNYLRDKVEKKERRSSGRRPKNKR